MGRMGRRHGGGRLRHRHRAHRPCRRDHLRSRRCLVALCCLGLLLAGCKVDPAPRTVARLDPGGRTLLTKAPYDGQYDLEELLPDARGRLQPVTPSLVSLHLARQQSLGFKRADPSTTTSIAALAGDQTIALPAPDATYLWQLRASPGQIDRARTTLLVVIVVGIIVGIAIGAAVDAASPDFSGFGSATPP